MGRLSVSDETHRVIIDNGTRVFTHVTDFRTGVKHPSLPMDNLVSFRSHGKLYHYDHRIVDVQYESPTQSLKMSYTRI